MPYLYVQTNVPSDEIPDDLPSKLCTVISKSLGRPLNFCCASVVGSVPMSWGGTDKPAAQASLMTIGGLGTVENKKHSKAISECITEAISVPSDRMYISFTEAPNSAVGYNGTTFHEIFGK